MALRTQWRHGFAGRTGMDYAAVLSHLRHGMRLPRRKLLELYAQIRIAEEGALEGDAELREQRETLGGVT